MAKGATRPYEVAVTFPGPGLGVEGEKRIYLVDAASASGAEKFVASKFVGEAKTVNGKRVAELMSAPHNVKLETAIETPPPATGAQ